MNPYYYLFYRLSRILNKKGNNELGPIGAISILIGMNALIVYGTLLPITPENYQGPYKQGWMALVIIIFIMNMILFLNKKRAGEIMNRYSSESARSRRIGGFLVLLYFVMSFALIFIGP